MKKVWGNFYQLILIGSLVLTVSACTKEDDNEFTLSRKFTPSTIATLNGQTQATVGWTASLFTLPGEASYVVEISRDSAQFGVIDFTTTTQELQITITDQQVPFINTKLYARIKTVGNNVTTDSNWGVSAPFMITGEQLFLPLVSTNVTDKSVILSFQPSPDFTKIVLTPVGVGNAVEVTISATESAAGSKQVDNLIASKGYTAELFKGELGKGTIAFSTKPAVAGTLVTDPSGLVAAMNAAASGSTLLLKRGVVFNLSAASYSFSKSLTIMSAYELGVPAQAKINNNSFNIVANSTIDSIVFRDVFIYTPDINTGKYGFNINTVCTVNKIRFDNCRVENVRSMARAQTGGAGAKITNLFISNCVVDSVRDFGVVGQSGTSSFFNITIQNSTFYKAQKFIISTSSATTNSSVTIKNCTFNDLPTGGAEKMPPVTNYFIDYSATTATWPSSIIIQNSIFGKSRSDLLSPPSTTAGGYRSSTPVITNCYATSDFLITVATAFSTTPVGKTSTSLWQDPKNGDFRFKDLTFAGINSAGDPRWRP